MTIHGIEARKIRSLKSWNTGRLDNGEAVLVVSLYGAEEELVIMMPTESAEQLGDALADVGRSARRPPENKLN